MLCFQHLINQLCLENHSYKISSDIPWNFFFFLKEHPHHVLKYKDGDLAHQLYIQSMKRNICAFFFYEYNPMNALTLKTISREICSWRKSIAELLQTRSLDLVLLRSPEESRFTVLNQMNLMAFASFHMEGSASPVCHNVSAIRNFLQKEARTFSAASVS
jgi:hypothetical protein